MKFDLKFSNKKHKKPEDFLYIGQDNYYIVPTDGNLKYLYSDSATSCIIVIVEGKDKDGQAIVALTHLSRVERFNTFFNYIETLFVGEVSVFAQGANPSQLTNNPSDTTSLRNENSLLSWVVSHTSTDKNENVEIPPSSVYKHNFYIESLTLSLGIGDPQEGDKGCYGIDLATMIVSNKRLDLKLKDRDPSGGLQTLFCVFGLKVLPQIHLHYALSDFTKESIDALVAKAKEKKWQNIATMSDDEILNQYSSTPKYESPWFCDTMRESSNYVINYKG